MNIQPGDKLAWITGYGNGIDGLFVTVQRRVIPGETIVLSTGRELTLREDRTADWIITAHTPMPMRVSTGLVMTTIRPMGDRFLRPVRGNPAEQMEHDHEFSNTLRA